MRNVRHWAVNPGSATLIDRLVQESVEYLSLQIEAGAQAVQIFDSWAGELPGRAGDVFVVDPLCRMVAALKKRHPKVPVIVFGRGFGVRQPELAARTGANAIGLESELPMGWAAENVGQETALQGNLDPVALQCDARTVRAETRAVLEAIPDGSPCFQPWPRYPARNGPRHHHGSGDGRKGLGQGRAR